MTVTGGVSGYGVELALRATGLLAEFNAAGILSAADVHVARRLSAIAGETDDAVLLAAALVVRSTRHGSVVLDLATAQKTTSRDVDAEGGDDETRTAGAGAVMGAGGASGGDSGGLVGTSADARADAATLPWPGDDWVARVAASPLVTMAADGARASLGGALRIVGSRIWLARYWDQEEQVARELLARASTPATSVVSAGEGTDAAAVEGRRQSHRLSDLDRDILAASLDRLFSAADSDQRAAAEVCATARLSVLAGGPGTGKTTTVSRLLALLREQHPDWRIAMAAPTGKAAARLEEAVRSSTAQLDAADQQRLGDLSAMTLHRLLGWRPGARSRFRHDATNRLPYEIVIIDEASMVSLTLMARLLEALRPTTRLILVGDPDQLASVEAGAVLGDLVDSTVTAAAVTPRAADTASRESAGTSLAAATTPPAGTSDRTANATTAAATATARPRITVATLTTNHRFSLDGGIALLAKAIQAGRADEALEILRSTDTAEVELVEVEDGAPVNGAQLLDVRRDVVASGGALLASATAGDEAGALAALDAHRLLCAHRRGPRGVAHWSTLAQRWIADAHPVLARVDGRYAGEPLLVTANDYEIGLYNGDTGVVVAKSGSGSSGASSGSVGGNSGSVGGNSGSSVIGSSEGSRDGELVAVFGRGGAPFVVPLVRLGSVRPLHAMTVHRSQGSQFAAITVLLAAAGSPLGTRETLYTAVTRATTHVRVIGSPAALVEAVGRPAARATGLRDRLAGAL